MKTINIMGKAVPVSVLALVAMAGIGSAALVGYISNTITVAVITESPMKLLISKTDSAYAEGSIGFGTIHGGESVEFYTLTQNYASVATLGTSWNVVSNPEGVTCNTDFNIQAETRSGAIGTSGSSSWTNTTSFLDCVKIDNNQVRIKVSPTEPWSWPANYEDNMHFTIRFATDASGTYTLTSYIKP